MERGDDNFLKRLYVPRCVVVVTLIAGYQILASFY